MTVQMYQDKAKTGDPVVADIPAFIREFFPPECASVVDVYCDPPFDGWKEMANQEDLPLSYYFAIGCHPHNAKKYNDSVEKVILEAMKHPYSLPQIHLISENVLHGAKLD
jgi:TatD DNase family protein